MISAPLIRLYIKYEYHEVLRVCLTEQLFALRTRSLPAKVRLCDAVSSKCHKHQPGDGVSRLRKGQIRPTLILHDGGTGGTRIKGIPA